LQKAECPECGKDVLVGFHLIIGKTIRCEGCGAELEDVWLDPVELDWVFLDDDEDD